MGRAIAVAWLFSERMRLAPETAEPLAILVEEWVLNLVEHGGAAADSQIVLRIERRGDGVRVTISDGGAFFDPRVAEMKGPNQERGGGAGIALMQAWSRIVDYRRRGGRNRLVLEIG